MLVKQISNMTARGGSDMGEVPRARVFISCGQQKDTNEVEIANRIADKLERMGFDPYIAVAELTLKGVKENIFRRLSESEYFIFVDFKRERLATGKNEDIHRGSLFSHQELAIASFLDIEVLPFQEEGVRKEDGILRFIQANCVPFRDSHLLPEVVAEKVREQGWQPDWRNELRLEREPEEYDRLHVRQTGTLARYYHIKVWNRHRSKTAQDCVAYLERVSDLLRGKSETWELVEFKWKGITTPRIGISPRSFRYLDAFHVFEATPKDVHLAINHAIVDYSGYYNLYTLHGPGEFELTYVVFCENFSPVRATYRLNIGSNIDDIQFT